MNEPICDPFCSRCNSPAPWKAMSMFDHKGICMDCKDMEKKHPDYGAACEAEKRADSRGDYDFPGIGKPLDL